MEIKPILLALKRNKFLAALLVIQIAFTMAVVSNSVFISVGTLKEWNLPSGIPHDDIIRVTPRFYDRSKSVTAAVNNDVKRLQEMPGVLSVTPTSVSPFASENVTEVYLTSEEEAQEYQTVIYDGTEHFLNTLQLELLEGRAFTAADMIYDSEEKNSEVMLSEDMAKKLFPDSTAIGKTVWLSKGSDPVQVVGVYGNFMTGETLNYYGKSYQSILRARSTWNHEQEPQYLIRMEPGIAESKLEDVASVFYQEQGRYLSQYERLKRVQKRMYDGRGSRALTFLVISAVLVFITAFGIAGLTSFQVNQRRKQIGTRRALGARKSDILKYFLTENSIISLVGLVLGLIVTLVMTFELSNIEQENLLDIGLFIGIALLFWAINIVATLVPAMRAANISPATVTRGA